MIELYPHQREAVAKMHNGCILVGDVGTGKSRTALAYYDVGVCVGMLRPPLYIITTARKRDTKDWEKECEPFGFEPFVDSWNNIQKYTEVDNSFFIFDEQRVVGKGVWVKAFIRISRRNQWILLSATPGDTWMDYIPVFIANGFYRNRTDFTRQHVIYSRFSKFPKVDRYVNVGQLMKHRREIVVNMPFAKKTVPHDEWIPVPFDKDLVKLVISTRYDPYKDKPIQDAGGLCYVLRRAVNSDERRIEVVEQLLAKHPRAVIFYNFNYELYMLKEMAERLGITCREWNGHVHEAIPEDEKWIYLVHYAAGAEGWNCIETDTMIFYSLNYSYKCMTQSAGRIDRLNTPFTDLYYYHLYSRAGIDLAIRRAVNEKRDFNVSLFAHSMGKQALAK